MNCCQYMLYVSPETGCKFGIFLLLSLSSRKKDSAFNLALIEECDSLVGVSFMHTDISLLVVFLVLMCRRH